MLRKVHTRRLHKCRRLSMPCMSVHRCQTSSRHACVARRSISPGLPTRSNVLCGATNEPFRRTIARYRDIFWENSRWREITCRRQAQGRFEAVDIAQRRKPSPLSRRRRRPQLTGALRSSRRKENGAQTATTSGNKLFAANDTYPNVAMPDDAAPTRSSGHVWLCGH